MWIVWYRLGFFGIIPHHIYLSVDALQRSQRKPISFPYIFKNFTHARSLKIALVAKVKKFLTI